MMRTFGGNPIEGIRAVPQEKIIIIDNKGENTSSIKVFVSFHWLTIPQADKIIFLTDEFSEGS